MEIATLDRAEAGLEAPGMSERGAAPALDASAVQEVTAKPGRARRWSVRRKRLLIILAATLVLAAGVIVALVLRKPLDPFVTCLASPSPVSAARLT